MIIKGLICSFLHKNLYCACSLESRRFYEDLSKNISQLIEFSSKMFLISSSSTGRLNIFSFMAIGLPYNYQKRDN